MKDQNAYYKKSRDNSTDTAAEKSVPSRFVARFYVFKDDVFLGWDCFSRGKVRIGCSSKADIILHGDEISDIHAVVYLKGAQIIVSDQTKKGGVLVNNRKVKTVILGRFDYITIGSYTIKIKCKEYKSRLSTHEQKEHNGNCITGTAETKPAVHKKIEKESPFKKMEGNSEKNINKDESGNNPFLEKHDRNNTAPDTHESKKGKKRDTIKDNEEDEEDLEAKFSLKEKIFERKHKKSVYDSGKDIFEVIKFRNDSVIDVCYLKPKEKYFIPNGIRKFLLAENKDTGKFLFYYTDQISGNIKEGDAAVKKTDDLKTLDTLYNKRKGIYRYSLTKGCEVTIYDGIFGYLLHPVSEDLTSEIQLPEKEEKIFHKYLIKSSVIHLIFLILIGLFHSVKKPEFLPSETYFVKIDRSVLFEMKKKTSPIPEPVVKQEKMELKPEKKSIAMNQKNKPIKVASKKQEIKRKSVASGHPQAGGGFGKGNIKNRNINQTGLLSMLGDSVGIAPQTAMAAVTNLDAVSSARPSDAGFKVGGIVGKLGDVKISIPKTGIVSTKGSSQVLRSVGVQGKGMVAALEKGETGQKQVRGMVSAKLNKTVSVQGGMSREAVKRVIDQHMDEISYCYEVALISNPSIMGKVIFEWKILTSGKVGMVQIKSSSINSSEIHSCIKMAIQTWQFPKPKGSEVIVSYPFVFDIVGF